MKKRIIGSILGASLLLGSAAMASDPKPSGMSAADQAAAQANYVLPSPFTLYAAFNKLVPNVEWSKYVSKNMNVSYESDPQLAYNLGLQVSKAYLLFNDQKLSANNIAMIDTFATKLGVEKKIVRRITTIKNAVIASDIKSANNEINTMMNDIGKELNTQSRIDLAIIIDVSTWLGAMNAVSGAINDNYSKKASSFLAQKSIVTTLYKDIESRQSLVFDTTSQEIVVALKEIEKLLGSKTELTKAEVKQIHHITSKIVTNIEKI